jgi:hypothetical protein
VKSQLHSLHIRVRENSLHAVVIEDFYFQVNARRHDLRGASGLKLDGIARLLSGSDVASRGFAFDLVSIHDNAGAELFGKLSKTDLIALFNEDFAALVNAGRPGAIQIERARL